MITYKNFILSLETLNNSMNNEYLILAGWCSSTFNSYLDFSWNGKDLFVFLTRDKRVWYSRAELILQYNLPISLFSN